MMGGNVEFVNHHKLHMSDERKQDVFIPYSRIGLESSFYMKHAIEQKV